MTKTSQLLFPLAGLLLVPAASAVTLNFDNDLEGFMVQGGATTIEHSTFSGGSMALTVSGGWAGNAAVLALHSNADLWAEIQSASVSGGSIAFDLLIDTTASSSSLVNSDTGPTWLQPVVVGNSTHPVNGWDQTTMSSDNLAAGGVAWPTPAGVESISVSLPIIPTAGGGPDNADGAFWVDPSGGWSNLHFGVNSQGDAFASDFTVYIDNVSVTAVPEPSSVLLSLVGVLGVFRRRR